MKITKENAIAQVQSSISSIFSKDDVLFLINSIEVGSNKKITPYDIEKAIERTIDWIENNQSDVVCLDDAEFELSYDNRIECISVGINIDEIRSALENNFCDFAEDEEEDDIVELSSSEYVPVEEDEL
jgi:hypothetical protein